MKKTTLIILTISFSFSLSSWGQSKREIKKIVKQGVKELKKQGWEITGTIYSLETEYEKFVRNDLGSDDWEEVTTSIYCTNPNQCQEFGEAAVRKLVIGQMNTFLDNEIKNKSFLDATEASRQDAVNEFSSNATQKMVGSITAEMLKPYFSIRRKPKVRRINHRYEYQVFCLKNNRLLEENAQKIIRDLSDKK